MIRSDKARPSVRHHQYSGLSIGEGTSTIKPLVNERETPDQSPTLLSEKDCVIVDSFKQAILPAPTVSEMSGKLHRFHVESDHPETKKSWPILSRNSPSAGSFGCWKRGISNQWSSKPQQSLSPAEEEAQHAKFEGIRVARDQAQAKVHAVARKQAKKKWEKAKPSLVDQLYLAKKGVAPYGVHASGNNLLVPLLDTAETLQGLQFINQEGGKKYLPGTNKRGALFPIEGKADEILYLYEGFATGASIHQATGDTVATAFDARNLRPVAETLRNKYPRRHIVCAADNDAWTKGNPGASKTREAADAVGGLLVLPSFQQTAERPIDFNDRQRREGAKAARRQIEAASGGEAETPPRLMVVDIDKFLTVQFPPRENLLSPWLPQQGLCMVYAPRGLGKTHFALNVAYAVASSGTFLRWRANRPRGVLFIDGEMPGIVLQERLTRIVTSDEKKLTVPLKIITPDLQTGGMINLSDPEGQATLNPHLDDIDLIVVDNLSTLCRSGKESEGESWLPVQDWALQQRASGRSVLFIHHSGKNGEQRGTSRREDVLDTVIALRRPVDYTPDKGASFEVHFEKARGVYGEDTKPFEATLITEDNGRQRWTMKELEASTAEKVAKLLNEGVPQREISEMLDITKGAVSKAKTRAQNEGLLNSVS